MSCRHSCEHHCEAMDPRLWRNLPEELVELVFGRLPIAKITHLCTHYKAWHKLSESSNFRRTFAERQPMLFGLQRRGAGTNGVGSIIMYDMQSKEWCSTGVNFFARPLVDTTGSDLGDEFGYDDSMYASDGGLVCLVPRKNLLVSPILVINPLTNVRKFLPRLALENKEPVTVQLLMEEDTKCYRVMLVCREKDGGALAADCYDSIRTCEWSRMESGLVYGGSNHEHLTVPYLAPKISILCGFDCTTKKLSELEEYFGYSPGFELSIMRDRAFTVHTHEAPRSYDAYFVSEYTWDSKAWHEREMSMIESTLPRRSEVTRVEHFFISSEFLLLIADDCNEGEHHHRLTRLYDLSTEKWHDLESIKESLLERQGLNRLYMCKLQWDVVP